MKNVEQRRSEICYTETETDKDTGTHTDGMKVRIQAAIHAIVKVQAIYLTSFHCWRKESDVDNPKDKS